MSSSADVNVSTSRRVPVYKRRRRRIYGVAAHVVPAGGYQGNFGFIID